VTCHDAQHISRALRRGEVRLGEPTTRHPPPENRSADEPAIGGRRSLIVAAKGLGNKDVELARVAPLGDRLRDRVTVRLQVGDDVGNEIDQAL